MMQTLNVVRDQIDLLPQRIQNVIVLAYEHKERVAVVAITLVLVTSLLYVMKKTGLTQTALVKLGVLDPDDLREFSVIKCNHNHAKFMMRESAKLIASALEAKKISPIEGYEQALQAAVLARTAKEIHKDASKLGAELGVDFWEYLAYTSTVVNELRTNALGKHVHRDDIP